MFMVIGIWYMAVDFRCDNDTYHRQNANGVFTETWNSVRNHNITYADGLNIAWSGEKNASLYYKHGLYSKQNDKNYTVVTKLNSELNLEWEKVYEAGSEISEKLIFDNRFRNLYSIFKIRKNKTW